MNKVTQLLSACVVLCSLEAINAAPGGYIAKGGVYDFKKPLDYLQDATHAGRMAQSLKIEDEAELGLADESRGARNAQYIPTFYTSAQGNQAPVAAVQPTFFQQPDFFRQAREAGLYDQPLYYRNA